MTIAKLDLEVKMEEMKRVKAFALSIASEAGLNKRQTQDLHLIAEEAMSNIVNYSGATTMSISTWQENNRLYVAFIDNGAPFDPTQYPSPNLNVPASERKIGGLGIYYIRTLTDSMEYRREDGKNILRISKLIR